MKAKNWRMKISACIVDDEELAIKELQLLLSEHPEIEVCGTAKTAEEAIFAVNKQKPDIVFLDIQLLEVNAFSIIDEFKPMPFIVFVTAYDKFATDAFEINALDYLLKPIRPERLQNAISRFKTNNRATPNFTRKYKYSDKILITERNEYVLINIAEITSICSDGDYTVIHKIDGKKNMISRSMNKWEELLPENSFERIHRSTIINLEYIHKIEKGLNNTCLVFIQGQKDSFQMSQRATTKFLSKYKV